MHNNYIRASLSNPCVIPKATKKKVKPMKEYQIADFLKAIKGHKYENMFLVALFTGIREGEVCGPQWECVDFDNGTILIDKQLQSLRGKVRSNKGKQKSAFEIQNNLNLKSGENKKKPLDSGAASDEGFDNIFACKSRQKSRKPPVF